MDLLEAMYQLSKAPDWWGWALIAGGACALSFLVGAGRYEKEHADD